LARGLAISIGQCSEKGRKDTNQDFHGALIPDGSALALKGIAVAIADGIGSSPVSQVAAESAVKTLMTDYFSTPDAWSVKTAAQRVVAAANSWLHAETRRSQSAYDLDRGYICTLSALILKGRRAHVFHIGDGRICRLVEGTLEQLTEDHRTVLSSQETYLGRALGMAPHVEIDHLALDLAVSDVFVLTTDGVHEHVPPEVIARAVRVSDDLDHTARLIVDEALARGSIDDRTVQIVRIDRLPVWDAGAFLGQVETLPAPPLLDERSVLDGYTILRPLKESSRSHIYLASDPASGRTVSLKIPSIDLRDDPAYRQRFILEEWIARRLNNPHVVRAHPQDRRRTHLYTVTEYVEGQTLAQWMIDHPKPDIETVRRIVEQIAAGLRAFHRLEMVHQDLRPENVMIDLNGTVKIIDFGSTRVAGVEEAQPCHAEGVLGTHQYAAPEYFVGETGTSCSDLFSLGVIAYQMLTGNLPYGAAIARTRTRAHQRKLRYVPAASPDDPVPEWVDGALRKAVHPDPSQRYQELSEFLQDLRHPNPALTGQRVPLYDRNPLLFWKALSGLLALALVWLMAVRLA
ncbi:MAG TPA: bifunctional protein-serine/threonine kinase/phosphatase, partial [Beijerinckiaceae bacterium]|nr:bifunctional protein-serine/threonine kinase/phosphatase [Beijerinckiaceae bacterium]